VRRGDKEEEEGGGEDKTWVCVAMANSVYNILPVDNPLADHAALLFPEVCGILLFLSVSLSLSPLVCVYACECVGMRAFLSPSLFVG